MLGLALLCFGAASANESVPLIISDRITSINVASLGRIWIDETGTATINQVAEMAHRPEGGGFLPQHADTAYKLGSNKALWMHYRITAAPPAAHEWLFEVPLPLIDTVTFFQRDAAGKWTSRSAGDTIAVSQWPQAGRYPHFYFNLPESETRDFFLRIKHLSPVRIPLRLSTDARYHDRAEFKNLIFGMVLGVFGLLVLTCAAQSWIYRDSHYTWYALYGVLVALAIAAYSGIAASLLWPDSGWWSDTSRGFFAITATAASCAVVRKISRIRSHFPRLDQAMMALSAGGVGLAVIFVALPRSIGLNLVGLFIPVTVATLLTASFLTARTGDPVGKLLLAAHVPLALATSLTALAFIGVIAASWFTQYAAVIAILIEVPLSLVALNIRSRNRHSAMIHRQDAATRDALTGLMTASLFEKELELAVAAAKLNRHLSPAVVYFDFCNYEHIKHALGFEIAEQSLLRSVSALHEAVDQEGANVSRIGPARFAMILKNGATRASISEIAVRVITNGLLAHRYGQHTVTLRFHVAAALFQDHALDARGLVNSLNATLISMLPGTHRQLRFVEPDSGLIEQVYFASTTPA